MQQPQLTLVLILVVVACVWAETKVNSNAEPLQAEESSVDIVADKHQEKRYVGSGYYGSNVDSYYNPYNTRGLGYDNGYSNLGYGAGYGSAGYGTAGYGGVGYGTAGYGGLGYGTAGYGNAGYGGYAGTGYNNGYNGGYGTGYSGYGGYGAGYGGYNPYYNSRVGTGYAGYRPGYNSYPSSYYSGGYGSSIVGGSLGSLGGAAGIIPPIVPGVGY